MSEIKKFVQDKKIPYLVHFTNINNLESIMENGLLPRDRLDELDDEAYINDELRLDGHYDSVSTSIAFPNSQMFYRTWKDSDDYYCILGLDKSILWDYDCAFCKHNAADNIISSQNIEDLKTIAAFREMYDEFSWLDSRKDQSLKSFDPTDVQAEVLVFDEIDPSYILGAVYPTKELQREFESLMDGRRTYVNSLNKGFFGSRSYSRKW